MTASSALVLDPRAFNMIISLAPNLKFASLVSEQQNRLRRVDKDRWYADLGPWLLEGREDFKPNGSLRHLTLDNWALSAETLEYWSRFVDLAKLESFKCSRGLMYVSYFSEAPKLLTNLKHLSLNLSASHPDSAMPGAVELYIETCPPLSTLSLWGWRDMVSLPSILVRHGLTLTALHLHEREIDFTDLRDALSVEELRTIRESCPSLRTLTCDLNRASAQLDIEDYTDFLEELGQFSLDHLQIYLDYGLPWLASMPSGDRALGHDNGTSSCDAFWEFGEDEARSITRPTVDEDAHEISEEDFLVHPPSTNQAIHQFLTKTWEAVFGSRSTGPRKLELKFGEWESTRVPLWRGARDIRDVRVWCEAVPHERDDKQGECVIEMHCCGGRHPTHKLSAWRPDESS
jgi:hypothetical protein